MANLKSTGKALVITATAVIMTIVCTACGGNKKSTIKSDSQGRIIELRTANQPESGEYDPAGAAGYVYFTYQSYTLQGLVKYDPNGAMKPATAESWDISPDLKTYTFHLRNDAKWSDGSDVTSADFKNTIVRALNPDNGSWYVDFLFVIKGSSELFSGKGSVNDLGITCPDDKTLVITLYSPCAYFLDLCCNIPTYMPSNSKYATDADKTWDMDPAKNLGNGPWHMAERKAGEYVVYEKNPYYYDAEKVNVLKITDLFMDDDQAKASAYQTGEINILSGAPSTIAEAYEGKPDLKFSEVPQTNYILFNINMKPFDDVRVRKAFSLALNRKDISAVVGKSCVPSTTLVGKFYKSKVNGASWGQLQGNLLDEDLTKAKQLLAEAGYPEGKGLPKIIYTYPAMNYEGDVAQVLQQEWKQLGVDVELQAMEYEVYVDERRNGKLQLARHQWYADYNDPTTWLMMYADGNSLNDIKWKNIEYNKLLTESNGELDVAGREQLLLSAEKILVSDETVVCPLFTNNNTNLIDPCLIDYHYDVLCYADYTEMKVKK
jgi:oligopeptide transport system substrate-binding protein